MSGSGLPTAWSPCAPGGVAHAVGVLLEIFPLYITDTASNNINLLSRNSWRRSWDIIVPGNFSGSGTSQLVFYDRTAGQGEIYNTDAQGNLTLLTQSSWRPTWKLIVPIPGNLDLEGLQRFGLLFYER
jgi:hypothetical protein